MGIMARVPGLWVRRQSDVGSAPASGAAAEASDVQSQMSPEDRAVIESLVAAGDVDLNQQQVQQQQQQQGGFSPGQQVLHDMVKSDAEARARTMVQERLRANGSIGQKDIQEITEELKAQYRASICSNSY